MRHDFSRLRFCLRHVAGVVTVFVGLAASTCLAGPYEEWKAAHFTPAELLNPTISGDFADPDGDGRVNLLEYALGSDPRIVDALAVNEPTVSLVNGMVAITYARVLAAADVIYRVEISSDLVTWTYGSAAVTFIQEGFGSPFRSVTIADITSLNDNVNPHFLRLRVLPNAVIDSDGDGIPDWWEIQYFGDLSKDGNWVGASGLTNLQAYLRGANPLVPNVPDAGLAATGLTVYTPMQ